MSTIFIEGIEFVGRHGWFDHERADGVRFRVDVELDFDTTAAAQTDRLRDTIDYAQVAETIVRTGTGESVHLLERLAAIIAGAVFDTFHPQRLVLTLRKLTPVVAGQPAAVGLRVIVESG